MLPQPHRQGNAQIREMNTQCCNKHQAAKMEGEYCAEGIRTIRYVPVGSVPQSKGNSDVVTEKEN